MKKISLLLGLLTVSLLLNEQYAFGKTYETFIETNALKMEFLGPYPGGQMGAAIASGDIDGDKIEDIVVASPFSSVFNKQWNGAISVYFGKDQGLQKIDFYGDFAGDQLGTNLTVGDFDNDGVDDIAVSAYTAQNSLYGTESKAGKVYIIYGKRFLTSQTGGQEISSDNIGLVADLIIPGKNPGDLFGLTLLQADINADGISDLIVGAPMAFAKSFSGLGAVYVYFGTKKGIEADYSAMFTGQNIGEKFGSAMAVGDLNGNGKKDIVISAPQAHQEEASQAGKVYVYLDTDLGKRVIQKPELTLNGLEERGWFGFSLDIGHLNKDKYDDLIISSFPFNGASDKARIKGYYGKKLVEGDFNPAITIKNPLDSKLLGAKVILEDLNKDEVDEIIMGAPGIGEDQNASGDLYIIYSSKEGYQENYSIKDFEMNSLIHGEEPDDWFGYNFNSLDFNADGFKDLVIGARYADSPNGVNNGVIYVLQGDEKPFGRIKAVIDKKTEQVNRGDLVKIIINSLDLGTQKENYLKNCKDYIEFCLFNFTAMSSFDDIKLEPELILYPDVNPGDEYYEDITTATMLGLVTGYMNEENSPFHPERPVTRVQALKIILGAGDLVPPKYQFELISMLGSYANLFKQASYFKDVDSKLSHMWWYPRYVNFAVENEIIDEDEYFRPDDNITTDELNDMISRAIDVIN